MIYILFWDSGPVKRRNESGGCVELFLVFSDEMLEMSDKMLKKSVVDFLLGFTESAGEGRSTIYKYIVHLRLVFNIQ